MKNILNKSVGHSPNQSLFSNANLKLPNIFNNPNLSNILNSLQLKHLSNFSKHSSAHLKNAASFSQFAKYQDTYYTELKQDESCQLEKRQENLKLFADKIKQKSALFEKTVEKYKQHLKKDRIKREEMFKKEQEKMKYSDSIRKTEISVSPVKNSLERYREIMKEKDQLEKDYVQNIIQASSSKHQRVEQNLQNLRVTKNETIGDLQDKVIQAQAENNKKHEEKELQHITKYIKSIQSFQKRVKQMQVNEEQLILNKSKMFNDKKQKVLQRKRTMENLRKSQLEKQDALNNSKIQSAQLFRQTRITQFRTTLKTKTNHKMITTLKNHSFNKENEMHEKEVKLQSKLKKAQEMQVFKRQLEKLKQSVINRNFFLTA